MGTTDRVEVSRTSAAPASPSATVGDVSPVSSPPSESPGPRPIAVGVAVAIAAALFVLLRLLAQGGDVTLFVRAGDQLTIPDQAGNLTVEDDNAGYDGQFAYRMARAPLSDADRVDGVGFDRPVDRVARIGYPTLAWVASLGGQRSLVPWALVGVNVVALGAIGALAAALARDAGRSSWWGVLAASAPGLVVALSRDLTEVVAAAFLLGGLVLLRRGRLAPAAAVLLLAALTRETTLVLPAAVLAVTVAGLLPRLPAPLERLRHALLGTPPAPTPAVGVGRRLGPLAVGLVPLVGYGLWRGYLATVWDAPRSFGDPGATVNGVTVPLVRPLGQLVTFFTSGDPVDLVQGLQLLLIIAGVTLVALAAWRTRPAPGAPTAGTTPTDDAALLHDAARSGEPVAGVGAAERVAIGLALLLLVSLTTWDRAVVFLRYPTDVLVLGAAVLPAVPALASRAARVAAPLALLSVLMWVGVA